MPGVYVSGLYDTDDAHKTSLTLLFSDGVITRNVTYSCNIAYVDGEKNVQMAEYQLNVNPTG